MRLDITSGDTIKKATAEDLVAALSALQDDSMTLIASDKPRCTMHVSGGPEVFKLSCHDGHAHKQYECPVPQDYDTTLKVLKSYLTERGDYHAAVAWTEVHTPADEGTGWEDPLEGQVNRGGCASVLALAAILGGGLWAAVTWI
jgi:hypothetical protein